MKKNWIENCCGKYRHENHMVFGAIDLQNCIITQYSWLKRVFVFTDYQFAFSGAFIFFLVIVDFIVVDVAKCKHVSFVGIALHTRHFFFFFVGQFVVTAQIASHQYSSRDWDMHRNAIFRLQFLWFLSWKMVPIASEDGRCRLSQIKISILCTKKNERKNENE